MRRLGSALVACAIVGACDSPVQHADPQDAGHESATCLPTGAYCAGEAQCCHDVCTAGSPGVMGPYTICGGWSVPPPLRDGGADADADGGTVDADTNDAQGDAGSLDASGG